MDSHQHHQRARWPRISHGSLDRERDDRLGRTWHRRLFEHWREILRAIQSNPNPNSNVYSYSDRNAHSYIYAHANVNSDADSNSDIHSDAYTDGDSDSNSYTYFDTETFTNAESCANAQAAYHATAPPVTCL